METQEQDAESPKPPSGNPPIKSGISKKPTQTLPSERLSFSKWKEIIQAYVVAAESNGGSVDNDEASKVVKMAPTSIVVTNAFFVDVGILSRSAGTGRFEVANEAKEYVQAIQWDSETAGQKLKPLFAKQWFSNSLLPLLKLRNYSMDEACTVLAEAAGGISKDYLPNLQRIVHFLDFVGLCKLEGNVLSAVNGGVLPEKPADKPAKTADEELPEDMISESFFLDKARTRKVTVTGPRDLSDQEISRISRWLKIIHFIEDDGSSQSQ
jgi:hypothetical protein